MNLMNILTIVALFAVVGIGAAYGYWIGTLGKRRGWRVHKVRRMAGIPPACLFFALMITGVCLDFSRDYKGIFPFAAMCLGAAVLSKFIAVRRVRPGVPVSVPDADDISIR
jgi:hypothetical protein